jgi:DNA-binding MarR family transcriptional regulator
MDNGECSRALMYGMLRLGSRLGHERPADSLTSNKVTVLAYLRRNGACTPSAVALAGHQQLQGLTRTFNELVADGLIERKRSNADRRASILSITDNGARALSHDLEQRLAWLSEALGTLSDAERQMLVLAADLLSRLADIRGSARDEQPKTPPLPS